MPFLELDKVSKAYQEGQRTRRVLDEMDLTIQSGEIIAILGKSGSGKSTLLNIISGIDVPASGSVRLQGRDLTALRERERTMFRRSQVGFIFQFFNLIPTLTVWENIILPLELSGNDNPDGLQRAGDLLAEVELADRADCFLADLDPQHTRTRESGWKQSNRLLPGFVVWLGAIGPRSQNHVQTILDHGLGMASLDRF